MKERLTGAVILVALIVLLVPELLSGPVRPARNSQPAATAAEVLPLRSYTIQIDDGRAARPTAGAGAAAQIPAPQPLPATPSSSAQPSATPPEVPAPINADAQASPAGKSTESGGATATAPPPQPAPVPEATAPAPHAPRAPATPRAASAGATRAGWAVQLGTFANRTNAEHLAEHLKHQGFHASVSELTSGGRMLYRVRAGSAADRPAAEQLAARVRAAGHTSTIVPK